MGNKIKLNKNSKISYIEVYNFMGYKHAKAYFDESGILNIKGYNSSGKSAFETAVAVCLMDAYKSKQGKFIHHGCDYFRVIVGFDDGVSIVKDKYISGQSLYEMYKDDEVIFTTKQGNKLAKVAEIPSVIKTYLDLIETDIGYLNYQTCRDPLWLIDTKGSDNYNTLNEVLKSEEISRANAMLNSDVNQLNSEIAILESEIQRKELQLQASLGVTEDLIFAIEEKEEENQKLDNRYKQISNVLEYEEGIEEIQVGYYVNKIEAPQLAKIESLVENLNAQESLKIPVNIEKIESKRLDKILNLYYVSCSLLEKMQNIDSEVEKMNCQEKIKHLQIIINEMSDILRLNKELKSLKEEGLELNKEKEDFIESAKKEGRYFVECKNCGTLMEVNTTSGV